LFAILLLKNRFSRVATAMNTPSKKIALLLVVALVFISGIVYFLFYFNQKTTYTAPTVSAEITNSILAKDSDNDGLKDWEEQLWKTDPNNPDTDGDGAKDGEEIKLGRDPLRPGPNDLLDANTVAQKINSETEQDLTETDKFSRELFIKIIGAKQSANPPTQADFEKFLNTTIDKQLADQKTKNFNEGNFQIDLAETPEKIRVYGNAIAALLKKPPPQKLENEVDVVAKAETTKDQTELKKLDGNIAAYKRIERTLLGLTVPQSVLPQHVAFTNAATSMVWSITGLQYLLTDPLKALPGTVAYADNAQKFFAAIRSFKSYFANANITFKPEDAGYQFFDTL